MNLFCLLINGNYGYLKSLWKPESRITRQYLEIALLNEHQEEEKNIGRESIISDFLGFSCPIL
jgi:hypothetical protein